MAPSAVVGRDFSRVVRVVAGTAAVLAVQVACLYAGAAGSAQVHDTPGEDFSGLGASVAWWAGGAVAAAVGSVVVARLFLRGRTAHPLLWAVWMPLVEVGALVLLGKLAVPWQALIAGVVASVAGLFVAGTRGARPATDAARGRRPVRLQAWLDPRHADARVVVMAVFTVVLILVLVRLLVTALYGK